MKNCVVLLLCLVVLTLPSSGQPGPCHFANGERITIAVFLAVDCPVSQKYVPVLNAIHGKYKPKGVDLIGFIPGKTRRREIRQFRKDYDIDFALYADSRYGCAGNLSATVTPEVFLFDGGKALKYRGAIDNWFYDLGGYRQESTENYLTDAVEALLEGRNPGKASAEPIGCPINLP